MQGLHRLELAWDRITYPVGEPEARLEVEAKRQRAARFLAEVHASCCKLYGKKLVPAPHGKAKEMCRRLYPDMFALTRGDRRSSARSPLRRLVAIALLYNRLVGLRNKTRYTWSDIDALLARRAQAIPRLADVVRGAMAHEKGVFEAVATRGPGSPAVDGSGPREERFAAERQFGVAAAGLVAVVEATRSCGRMEAAAELIAALKDVEGDLRRARIVYNRTVQTYQDARLAFPCSLVAGAFGFGPLPYFADSRCGATSPASRSSRRSCSRAFLGLLLIVTRDGNGQGEVQGDGKFYRLTHAVVDGSLGTDGALTVSERITFEFHGKFSGAFRDIPLPDNETFEEIGVREGATDYDPAPAPSWAGSACRTRSARSRRSTSRGGGWRGSSGTSPPRTRRGRSRSTTASAG